MFNALWVKNTTTGADCINTDLRSCVHLEGEGEGNMRVRTILNINFPSCFIVK